MSPSVVAEEGSTRSASRRAQRQEAGLPLVVPNRWQGEGDCQVGPFSGHQVAAYFAHRLVDFGHYEVFSMRVFARRNAWYVEVRTRGGEPVSEPVA